MKRSLGLVLLALPLAAGEALHIAAVERKGWPPFEDDRRVYRIEGAEVARLRVGEKLTLQRPGLAGDLGRLQVAALAPGYAEAYLDRRGSTYPLLGDQAEPGQGLALPRIPRIQAQEDLRPAQPRLQPPPEPPVPAPATAPRPGAPVKRGAHAAPPEQTRAPEAAPHSNRAQAFQPQRLEPVFFLEGDGALSPKGQEKLKRLVETWGADGVWSLGLPEDPTLSLKVREARIQAIRRALKAQGVPRVEVRAAELRPGDRGDVVYAGKD